MLDSVEIRVSVPSITGEMDGKVMAISDDMYVFIHIYIFECKDFIWIYIQLHIIYTLPAVG